MGFQHERGDSPNDPFLSVGEPIELSTHSQIRIAGVLHDPLTLDAKRKEFDTLIANSDYIALEANPANYATPEQRQSGDQPFDQFFAKIIELAILHNKPILFTDPYTQQSDATALLNNVDIFSGIFATAVGPLTEMIAIVQLIERMKNKQAGRRDFVRFSGATGVSTVSTAYAASTNIGAGIHAVLPGSSDSENPFERIPTAFLRFRNLGEAYGLQYAAQEGIVNGNGTLFIGREHKHAIEDNLRATRQQNENQFQRTLPYRICRIAGANVRAQLWVPKGNGLYPKAGASFKLVQ